MPRESRWPNLDDAAFMESLLLSQTSIDFDSERRGEEGLIDRLLDDAATRVMLVNGGMVAVPRDTQDAAPGALFCFNDPAAPRPDATVPGGPLSLALLSGADVREAALEPGALVMYLGVDRAHDPVAPYLALDISRPPSPASILQPSWTARMPGRGVGRSRGLVRHFLKWRGA